MNIVKNKYSGAIIQVDDHKIGDYLRYECANGGFQDITVKIVSFVGNSRDKVKVQFEKLPYRDVNLFVWNGSRPATQQEIDAYDKNGGPLR